MMVESRQPQSNSLIGQTPTLHALDYHWDEFEPHLECYDTLEKEECELDLKQVDFLVSEARTCIGSWDDDGNYRPCPGQKPVGKFAQCEDCSSEFFIPKQECVFNPECDGTDCLVRRGEWEFCKREHMLYFAFYDTRAKVGMSSSRRIDRRLIEQGADAYSIIGTFPNRLEARKAEKRISASLRIPEFYRQETLLESLVKPVDMMGIEDRLRDIGVKLGMSFGYRPGPIKWLNKYPIDLPLRQVPKLEPSPGRHIGERIGIKGKWMVYESNGLKALNLSDLPARFMARHVA